MMNDRTVIDIQHLEAGQPEQYADSRWRSVIRAKTHGFDRNIWTPHYLTRNEAKELARMLVHHFVDEPQWFDAQLQSLEPGNQNRSGKSAEWFVTITVRHF